MGYRPSAAFEVSARTSTGTGSILEEPPGLTPVVGLWPGQTGPIASRVIGVRVFSGTTLSTGVASGNRRHSLLNVLGVDIQPGNPRRLVGWAYRSTRA